MSPLVFTALFQPLFCYHFSTNFLLSSSLVPLSRLSRIVEKGRWLLEACLWFLLGKMVMEGRQRGWSQPSLHCQSCSRKSEAGPVHLHKTKGKAGGSAHNSSQRSTEEQQMPMAKQLVHMNEAIQMSDETGGNCGELENTGSTQGISTHILTLCNPNKIGPSPRVISL